MGLWEYTVSSLALLSLSDYLVLARTINPNCIAYQDFAFNLTVETLNVPQAHALKRFLLLEQIVQCTLDFGVALAQTSAQQLMLQLQALKAQLPDRKNDSERFNVWWQENHQAWTKQLISVIQEHQTAGHDWQFSSQQTRSLQQYCDANQLLMDCLTSDCYVTASVREEIEETLLLGV